MAVQFAQPHRFTAEEFRRMAAIGVIPEGGTELIDGVVVTGTRPFRFSSEDYHRLAEAGILEEDQRVELVDGEIIEMSPIGPRHSKCVARLTRLLGSMADRAEVRIQDVLNLRPGLEPRPDAAVYRARPDEYEEEQPTAADALLVVEVADSSLLYDRTLKTEEYAAAGVPEFWLVDLRRNVVVVSQDPVGSQFAKVHEYGHGNSWRSPGLGGREVRVEDVLGPNA